MKGSDVSKVGLCIVLVAALLSVGFYAGRIFRGDADGSSYQSNEPNGQSTAAAIDADTKPLFDFQSDESNAVLNAVLADWFVNPKNRMEPLRHLFQPKTWPTDGSRPVIGKVFVDGRTIRGAYLPKIPGIPTTVEYASAPAPLKADELMVRFGQYAVLPNGQIHVTFTATNHNGIVKTVQYRGTKSNMGWSYERLISE